MSLASLLIKLNSIKILYESTHIIHENIFRKWQRFIKIFFLHKRLSIYLKNTFKYLFLLYSFEIYLLQVMLSYFKTKIIRICYYMVSGFQSTVKLSFNELNRTVIICSLKPGFVITKFIITQFDCNYIHWFVPTTVSSLKTQNHAVKTH